MATAFDNTKHDVQLNDVPYRIRGYQKSELSTFIPRFGSGEQSESEFDLLRSASVKGFSGGELQRFWSEDTTVYGIEGLYNKYDDGVLYPTNTMTTDTAVIYGNSKPKMTAWCRSTDYLFVAYETYNTPTTFIKRTDKFGTTVTMSIPTSLSNSSVRDMVIHDGQLWVTGSATPYFYYNTPSVNTTLLAISGGTVAGRLMVVFRGELYFTGNINHSNLYRYTGDTTTRSATLVGETAKNDLDTKQKLFVYNNRIILTRKDGMFGYDGIQMNAIEDLEEAESDNNYKCPAVLKGYLYYFMPDGYYRFNGSLIEKLYDVSESGIAEDVAYGNNKLWYVYRNSEYAGSTRYDKSMGYDYETGDNVQGRVAFFDGQGMFTHSRLTVFDKASVTPDFSGQGEPDGIIYFNDDIYVTTDYSKYSDNLHLTTDPVATSRAIIITTSIFNAGFSQINKQLENLEMEFDGDITDETFTVEYRTSDFEGDTGWATLGTLTSVTDNKLNVYDLLPNTVIFRDIQFRVTATMTNTYGIKTLIARYILTPDYKYQWTINCLCYGDDPHARLQLQDRTEDTQDVADLRGNIYESRESDNPVGYIDVDYLVLNGAINASVTTITVVSTSILKASSGFVQIGSEIMKYTAKTATTLTVERGALGSTATTHSDGLAVYPYYRVVVRQIQNERMELSDEEGFSVNRTRDSEITIVLQEV